MGDMSPHFKRSEFACRCGCGLDCIDPKTVAALEKLRVLATAELGQETLIIVNCGCRCPQHNTEVGGEAYSFHLKERGCKAVDIEIPGLGVGQMAELAEQVPEFHGGGIGRYYANARRGGFIHCDVRPWKARWEG